MSSNLHNKQISPMGTPETTPQLAVIDRIQTIALSTAIVAVGAGVEIAQIADVSSSAQQIGEILSWAAIGSGVVGAITQYVGNRIRTGLNTHPGSGM